MAEVTRFGLGLAAVGRPAYINLGRAQELPAERSVEAMRAVTASVLDTAYAAGVRWIDVARSYGRAEEFLGEWMALRGYPDLTVSSKWGYAYVGGWRTDAEVHEVKEHSLARLTTQWLESREALGDAIALYQVHSLTVDSPLFTDRPLLRALADLAASGVRVGFSTSGAAQADVIRAALDLEVDGERVFTAVQSTWNVLEPSAGAALAEAHAAGCHVLVKEPLANGRLVVHPPAPVTRLAVEHRVGPDAVALAAVCAQPWADTVLLGPASAGQLESNLAAADVTLDGAELTALHEQAEDAHAYWKHRGLLAWS
ncbi:aldo/keto reductase [Haloechinothrix sp. YIM 98757]|uniref:Aldo/keto reductase n=1 Tax=Haloechinothrix aidingensis TaxID=2752311 RepID=A0A837ZZX6_9PSEU|nr:aldo/keto reductase [Haloechinothrix aidingensis]MBA0125814.1 aldo/keto reductase [Haloechinothrix aidingensis]